MDKSKFLDCVFLGIVLLSCAYAQFQPAHQAKVCPPGFTLYSPSNKCYALITISKNKNDNIAECSRLAVGAFIAAPLDAGEDLFIQSLIQGQNSTEKAKCERVNAAGVKFQAYYLGAESCERKLCNTFQWHLSGGYRQKMEYSNFKGGEPNCLNDNEFCLNYQIDFGWNDVTCSAGFCSVCEFRLA